jgi:excinuclease ABC subunit C
VGTGDADVIGYARDGDDAVGVLFRVRDGRVVHREHRFLENIEEEGDDAVLEAFLVRYYVPLEGRARRVVLPFAPAEQEQVAALMPESTLTVPQRGTARNWHDLAERNARHLLESLRLESFESDERADDPVYALGRDLGLATVPRTLVCVDISTNQGKDTVGSLVTFEGGRPKKANTGNSRSSAKRGSRTTMPPFTRW